MSFDLDTLYNLLPAIYRIRDLEHGEDVILRGLLPTATSPRAQADNEVLLRQLGKDPAEAECRRPLYALLQVIVEQIGILEDNLTQLYDDQFIETCAEWVGPYIGDQVGFHMPRPVPTQSLRSQVANTVAYRRRKGTTLLLEQLVRDVTGCT